MEFRKFLHKLIEAVKPEVTKPYLLLDNHVAHHTKETMALI